MITQNLTHSCGCEDASISAYEYQPIGSLPFLIPSDLVTGPSGQDAQALV
jgi:hypothetical protein